MKYEELASLHALPFFELLKKARDTHEQNWPQNEVQLCTLLSIKTGGCSEDCSYCSQSARNSSGIEIERLMEKDDIKEFYLGQKDEGVRGQRRWKKKKLWR